MSKIIINGKSVEGSPSSAIVPVNGKNLELQLRHVDGSALKWEFFPLKDDKTVKAIALKQDKSVSISLVVSGKVIFSSLTAQAMFQVLLAKFGQSKNVSDKIYISNNPHRKQGKGGSATVTITEGGTW